LVDLLKSRMKNLRMQVDPESYKTMNFGTMDWGTMKPRQPPASAAAASSAASAPAPNK
jgi:hypothetical protein